MAAPRKRVTVLCTVCGSTKVISDTRSEWNVQQQQWITVGHYDSSECLDCEQDTKLIEVELAPEPQT